MKRNSIYLFCVLFLVSCSMTKNIPEGDQLFTGLKHITYGDHEPDDNFTQTQEEVEAALATAPNGAIFGSSYYRVPFSWGVSVWNKYHDKDTKFAQWMTKTFGKQPVLMSWVNPELRAQVAQGVLRNNGYFNGRVGYDVVQQAVSSATDLESEKLMQKVNRLNVCGQIAPMLGLMGTVTGMVSAFAGLATTTGAAKSKVLAQSISTALWTTCVGLLISVPALLFYTYFKNNATRLLLESEAKVLDLIKVLRNVEVESE